MKNYQPKDESFDKEGEPWSTWGDTTGEGRTMKSTRITSSKIIREMSSEIKVGGYQKEIVSMKFS